MRKICFTALILFGIWEVQPVQAQEEPKSQFSVEKGLRFTAKDNSASLKFGVRIQPLFTLNYRDFERLTNPDLDEVSMSVRRARLKFDGHVFDPRWVYKLELALGNRNLGGTGEQTSFGARLILDAVIKYEFAPGYFLWFGQTKLPGNRERVISSQKLQFVDRSIVNGRFNIDRDMGFQLHMNKKIGENPIKLAAAISMGEGRNITDNNAGGLEYTLRAEYLPFGAFKGKGDYSEGDLERQETQKLSIGVTYDLNDHAVRQRGNQGSYLLDENGQLYMQSLSTWFVDMIWKYQGWSILSEYALKSADQPILFDSNMDRINSFYTGWGITAQGSYCFKSNWELAGRYSHV
ncbi:MAG: OprO/OprP family phosphate-selective porin, partial [Bacteroidota bacterium]|nr:OprO/OprP family phosphate-selective porin [Bacteroidota bacterium]MDX5426575.1 OprO/OprP family phosphate-selective porin [Bacteroidota bacterium]MDX5504588.1 OprO/OprP family phosphate-selective porin [Bacteroidota bacterium]